jgi:hypothetical protein
VHVDVDQAGRQVAPRQVDDSGSLPWRDSGPNVEDTRSFDYERTLDDGVGQDEVRVDEGCGYDIAS